RVGCDRGRLGLSQDVDRRRILAAGGIEGRVRQQPESSEFEQRRRAADVRQLKRGVLRMSVTHRSGLQIEASVYTQILSQPSRLLVSAHALEHQHVCSPYPA